MTGNTIYNLDAMGEYETDSNDRPLYPPRITSVEVSRAPVEAWGDHTVTCTSFPMYAVSSTMHAVSTTSSTMHPHLYVLTKGHTVSLT